MPSHHISRDHGTQRSVTTRAVSRRSETQNTTSLGEWGQHEDAMLYCIGENVVKRGDHCWEDVDMRNGEVFPGYEVASLEEEYQSLRDERDRLSIARALQNTRTQLKVYKLFLGVPGYGRATIGVALNNRAAVVDLEDHMALVTAESEHSLAAKSIDAPVRYAFGPG
ncbi:hypothetical protein ACMFMF_010880 [Clarireedia jacksonii]